MESQSQQYYQENKDDCKVKYIDFDKLHNDNNKLREKCRKVQPTVPSHKVEDLQQELEPINIKEYQKKISWKLDLTKIKSSIPKPTVAP